MGSNFKGEMVEASWKETTTNSSEPKYESKAFSYFDGVSHHDYKYTCDFAKHNITIYKDDVAITTISMDDFYSFLTDALHSFEEVNRLFDMKYFYDIEVLDSGKYKVIINSK